MFFSGKSGFEEGYAKKDNLEIYYRDYGPKDGKPILLVMGLGGQLTFWPPYMINRQLSYFPDTVLAANEMNRNHHLDHRLQFDFFINIVRKRKRFSKWHKPETVSDLEAVKKYYGYSNEKARQVLSLLKTDQINELKNKVMTGGRK